MNPTDSFGIDAHAVMPDCFASASITDGRVASWKTTRSGRQGRERDRHQ